MFITNGGCVENSSSGHEDKPAAYNTELEPGGGWDMWRKIAAQDPAFGHPDEFCHDPEQTNWMSATVETLDQEDHPLYQEHLQARPLHRPCGHRRHRHRQGLHLADELDHQPPAPVPRPAQGPLPGVGVLPVHRQARRLCEKAHARLHRQGDLHGVAVPHRRARGADRGSGRPTAPTPYPA